MFISRYLKSAEVAHRAKYLEKEQFSALTLSAKGTAALT